MTVYFTADTHFGHARAIAFCKRPFANADEMNEGLIERWNARVSPDDTVWCLGDFAFRQAKGSLAGIFARLNGRKHLIIGNHDDCEVLDLPWSSTPTLMAEVRVDHQGRNRRVALCHYPIRSWDGMYRDAVHLYGHEHGNITDYHNCCDVGVDRWHYQPVTFAEAMGRMARAPQNPIEITPISVA